MAEEKQVPAVVVPALPDHLKHLQGEGQKTDAESMAASSVSIPRISLRAKAFRYVVGGEEAFKHPGKTRFVILAVDPAPGRFIKTYYKGAYTGDSVPPTCSSQDGVRPDPWVDEQQSDLCSTCQMNRFGSATSAKGKKTKACRDSKRLWIVQPEEIEGTVFALGIPVTSLKALSILGKAFADVGVPISSAIVEATMDEEESYPIMEFKIVEWLSKEDAEAAIKRNTARNWEGGMRSDPIAVSGPSKVPAIEAPSTPASTTKTGNVDEAIKNW